MLATVPEHIVDTLWGRFGDPGDYLHLLDRIHQHLLPRTYMEIGVYTGASLMQVLPGTETVGVDPDAQLFYPVHRRTRIYQMTSDDFFACHDVRAILRGLPVDLSFIDGMHQFEFALRDFMNLERWSSERSVVLVHDCLPEDAQQASRSYIEGWWTGDVWKLIVCLKEFRPDLELVVADVPPTGLGIIRNLDPLSTKLREHYDEICERFADLPYSWLEEHDRATQLNLIDADWDTLRSCLPAFRFRQVALLPLKTKRLTIALQTMVPRWVSARARMAVRMGTAGTAGRSGEGG